MPAESKVFNFEKYSLFRLWFHINKDKKYQVIFLILLSIFSGLTDALSIAALIPFLSFIVDPNSIYNIEIMNTIINYFGLTNNGNILQLVIIIFGTSVIVSASLRILNLYLTYKISNNIGHDINIKLFHEFLNDTYIRNLNLDKNKFIASSTEYQIRAIGVIRCSLSLVTQLILTLSILIALFFINFKASILAGLIFGTSYLTILKITKRKYKINSIKIAETTKGLYKNIRNSIFSMREIKMDKNIKYVYLNDQKETDFTLRQARASSQFLAAYPRDLIEMILFLTISIFTYILKQNNNDMTSLITLLGAFVMASQKLLPSFQKIYSSWSKIRSDEVSLLNILELLDDFLINKKKTKKYIKNKVPINKFKDRISIENVSFSYGKKGEYDIKDINFEIMKGERIGIIGSSGSGKSTIIDLILNLLEPDIGRITIDGKDLREHSTHRIFSHVPQEPFIKAGTFLENIAYEVSKDKVDYKQLQIAADFANLKDFIENKPKAYDTYVKEFGSNLSGGQKQRIAIARAFYKKSDIIVFDEATNSLDIKTSKEINNELFNLPRDLTLLIIAHDYLAVEKCDRIIKLKNGKIEIIGVPHEILDIKKES